MTMQSRSDSPDMAGSQRSRPGLYWIAPAPPNDTRGAALARWWSLWDTVLAAAPARVQLRDKREIPLPQRRATARAALERARRHRVALILNDDADTALAIGAEGVHLGQQDLARLGGTPALAALRTALGPQRSIGVTCHDRIDLAAEADAAGADLLAFGAFFVSTTKPAARAHSPADTALLRAARSRFPNRSLCAIGGITATRAAPLFAAGADLVAAVAAIADARDPAAAVAAFHAAAAAFDPTASPKA